MPKPTMWSIELIIETDDEDDVERIHDLVQLAACPVPNDQMTIEHECPVPWFMITTRLSKKTAKGWRGTLNR